MVGGKNAKKACETAIPYALCRRHRRWTLRGSDGAAVGRAHLRSRDTAAGCVSVGGHLLAGQVRKDRGDQFWPRGRLCDSPYQANGYSWGIFHRGYPVYQLL